MLLTNSNRWLLLACAEVSNSRDHQDRWKALEQVRYHRYYQHDEYVAYAQDRPDVKSRERHSSLSESP